MKNEMTNIEPCGTPKVVKIPDNYSLTSKVDTEDFFSAKKKEQKQLKKEKKRVKKSKK